MFDLESILLRNFKSYAGEHNFDFPKEPGLYNFTGVNQAEPRLGSNGAGKSTFLDAIYWCIYGRTPRGLKSNDVVTRGEKGCTVSLKLTVGTQSSVITRKQSPNSLTLDSIPCDQETIQKFIRLAPDAFTYAVLIPQFGESFLDLAPTPKLTLLSQILELDYWLERSKDAVVVADELTQDLHAKDIELATCETRISLINEDLATLEKKKDEFVTSQQNELAYLKDKITAAIKEQKTLDERIDQAKRSLTTANTKFKATEAQIQGQKPKLEALQAERQQWAVKQGTKQAALTALRASLRGFSKLGVGVCPTCLQSVSTAHLKGEAAKLKTQEAALVDELVTITDETEDVLLDIKELKDSMHQVEIDLTTIRINQTDFSVEHSSLLQQKADYSMSIAHNRELSSQVMQRENPYASQITIKETYLKKHKAAQVKLKAEANQLTEDHVAVSYWINGFKKIRLFILEETLQQFEIEINNNLATLGLLDWHVTLDVERENKSGGITKGFNVLVHAPNHKEPVRFEAWSGGETQRLRLAGDMGLSNLIMHRAGLTSTIEFYDEPSKHLSQEGLGDLAEALHERAINSGKRILLVDHNVIDFGKFAGQITAIKDDEGSRLSVSYK